MAPTPIRGLPEHMEASNGMDVLAELRSGRRDTLDRLMPVVYEQLRLIARHQLAIREHGATLSTTGLVHEAYLKLVDQSRVAWSDRSHFFALASVAMRHILVDRAKARLAQKREGALQRVTLDNEQIAADDDRPELVARHQRRRGPPRRGGAAPRASGGVPILRWLDVRKRPRRH